MAGVFIAHVEYSVAVSVFPILTLSFSRRYSRMSQPYEEVPHYISPEDRDNAQREAALRVKAIREKVSKPPPTLSPRACTWQSFDVQRSYSLSLSHNMYGWTRAGLPGGRVAAHGTPAVPVRPHPDHTPCASPGHIMLCCASLHPYKLRQTLPWELTPEALRTPHCSQLLPLCVARASK